MSALAHDVGHPGFNNEYLVKSKHNLAWTYNDLSVLENFHSASMFEMLNDPNNNMFAFQPEQEYWSFRRVATTSIMNTDMKCHFELKVRDEEN